MVDLVTGNGTVWPCGSVCVCPLASRKDKNHEKIKIANSGFQISFPCPFSSNLGNNRLCLNADHCRYSSAFPVVYIESIRTGDMERSGLPETVHCRLRHQLGNRAPRHAGGSRDP